MSDYRFKVKMYGVRGSFPVASTEGSQIGGNTACVLVRTKSNIVIFDAGSGVINLGKELIPEILEHQKKNDSPFHITFLFNHTHNDHLLGLPFFAPLYMPGVFIHFFGPATLGVDFEQILRNFVAPQFFPVGMDEFRCSKEFHNIDENMIVYFTPERPAPKVGHIMEPLPADRSLTVHMMKYYFHPKDGSYPFKAVWKDKSFVYATDVEQYIGGDQRLINFAKNTDLFIHDAQYTEEQYKMFAGYGHSTFVSACDAAKQANVKKLLLFHHNPSHSDADLKEIEKNAQSLFPNTELAAEGWEWVV
ncbi:MAG: MBL fold metallo-hydrolase [Calditrichaeota bacterium]|nr:MBL fold metallo-hydrolase [Calditrichota bacterium]